MSNPRYKLTMTEECSDASAAKTSSFPMQNVCESIKRHRRRFGQGCGMLMFSLGLVIMALGVQNCCSSNEKTMTNQSFPNRSITDQEQSIPVETVPDFHYKPDPHTERIEMANYCEDFYETVCNSTAGERMNLSDPEDDNLHHTVRKQFREQFKMLLGEPSGSYEEKSVRDAKSLYTFCMDEESIEGYGLESVKNFLNGLVEWPYLNQTWLKGHLWKELLPLMKKKGYMGHTILTVEVVPDLKEDVYVIQIEPTTVSWEMYELYWENFKNKGKVFVQYINDVIVALGYNTTSSTDKEYSIHETSDLTKLLQRGFNHKNIRDKITEKPNQRPLKDMIPDAEEFIQSFFPKDMKLKQTDVVRVVQLKYTHQIIREFNIHHGRRKLFDYLIWRFLAELKDFLPKKLRDKPWDNFNGPRKPDRWEKCAQEVLTAFPKTSAAMYIKRYRNPGVEARVKEIFEKLKDQFKNLFTQMEWRDEHIQKLHGMSIYEDCKFITETDTNYSEETFEVVQHDPVQTILNLRQRVTERNYLRLHEKFNKDDRWFRKIEDDLLFPRYLKDRNQLYLPTKFVQTVLFNPNRKDSINYAVLGSMIAREIARAFFPQGSMDEKQFSAYKDIGNCYKEPLTANSMLEILVDNMGFQTAHMALEESLDASQLFWYHAAFSRCSEYTNSAKEFFGKDMPYVAPWIYVNYFSHLEKFRNALQCPENSPMNPSSECDLLKIGSLL